MERTILWYESRKYFYRMVEEGISSLERNDVIRLDVICHEIPKMK